MYRTENNLATVELNIQHNTSMEILGMHHEQPEPEELTSVNTFDQAMAIQGRIGK